MKKMVNWSKNYIKNKQYGKESKTKKGKAEEAERPEGA